MFGVGRRHQSVETFEAGFPLASLERSTAAAAR